MYYEDMRITFKHDLKKLRILEDYVQHYGVNPQRLYELYWEFNKYK